MHDIELIRQDPELFDQKMQQRGNDPMAKHIIELDQQKRQVVTEIQSLRQQKNALVKKISSIAGDEIESLKQQTKDLSVRIKDLESVKHEQELQNLLATLPNIAADIVPVGDDESANLELRKYKEPKSFSFPAKAHDELGERLAMMDFAGAARISGARFVATKGLLAKLERALISFMLDLHTERFGYTEVQHPCLVLDKAMYGVGQLPKFDEDSFKTTNGFRLLPTSEVFLTNIVSDSILSPSDLPLRFTACSPCFRSEAGSAGRDTRGMIRLHQFNKVELVSITKPQDSAQELERMTGVAEEVLRLLDLPYRVVLLSSGDMGFSARITYDLEVWLPSQNTYREISSCSHCGDFQARRMKARYKENDQINFVHTLNGSALAVGRTIVAIMENYQNADGSISIPEVLRLYMGGVEKIG